jgi:hypothetical protein
MGRLELPNLSARKTNLRRNFHNFGWTLFWMFERCTCSGAVAQESSMARNFGVPRHTYGAHRGSMWPLMALTLIMIGLVDVATHLHHW